MGYEFTALPFDRLRQRLFSSGLDIDCYKKMCEEIFPIGKMALEAKEYAKSLKDRRPKMLDQLARQCADQLPKFKNYGWEDVVLEIIDGVKMPAKSFSQIFGHVNEEKEIYPLILKQLRKDYEQVYDTTKVRGNLVRFGDFTVVKQNIIHQKKIISLDAKTRASAFDHFLNQARAFQDFSDEVYLIATPGLVL